MNEERKPQVFPLTHGVMGWMPDDPNSETEPKFIQTNHGIMVWLPYRPDSADGQSAQITDIQTVIGRIFWSHHPQELGELLAPAIKEIEEAEAENPSSDERSFFNSYLPLLLTLCLQDAGRQAALEAVAIVKARQMNSQPQRSKYFEEVARQATENSLRRFSKTHLYRPLKRGERERQDGDLAEIIERFFGERNRLKKAIREILQQGEEVRPRAIARKLDVGKPHKERARDTGIKAVESMLKRQCPEMTPSQAIAALVAEIKEADKSRGEKQIGQKNSRRKSK